MTSNRFDKVFFLLVKMSAFVCFLNSLEVVSPIEKRTLFSKELFFAKLRTPLGLKKTIA